MRWFYAVARSGLLALILFWSLGFSFSTQLLAATAAAPAEPNVVSYGLNDTFQCAAEVAAHGASAGTKLAAIREVFAKGLAQSTQVKPPLDKLAEADLIQAVMLVRAWANLTPNELATLKDLLAKFAKPGSQFPISGVLSSISLLVERTEVLKTKVSGLIDSLESRKAAIRVERQGRPDPSVKPGLFSWVFSAIFSGPAKRWAAYREFTKIDGELELLRGATETADRKAVEGQIAALDRMTAGVQAFAKFAKGELVGNAAQGLDLAGQPLTPAAQAGSEAQGQILSWLFLINWSPELKRSAYKLPNFADQNELLDFLIAGVTRADGGLESMAIPGDAAKPFLSSHNFDTLKNLFAQIMKGSGFKAQQLVEALAGQEGDVNPAQAAEIQKTLAPIYAKIPRGQLMLLTEIVEDVRSENAYRLEESRTNLATLKGSAKTKSEKEIKKLETEVVHLIGLRQTIWGFLAVSQPIPKERPVANVAVAAGSPPATQPNTVSENSATAAPVNRVDSAARRQQASPVSTSGGTTAALGNRTSSTGGTTVINHHHYGTTWDPFYPPFGYMAPTYYGHDFLLWGTVGVLGAMVAIEAGRLTADVVMATQRYTTAPEPFNNGLARAREHTGSAQWIEPGAKDPGNLDYLRTHTPEFAPVDTSTTGGGASVEAPPWEEYQASDFGKPNPAGMETAPVEMSGADAAPAAYVPEVLAEIDAKTEATFTGLGGPTLTPGDDAVSVVESPAEEEEVESARENRPEIETVPLPIEGVGAQAGTFGGEASPTEDDPKDDDGNGVGKTGEDPADEDTGEFKPAAEEPEDAVVPEEQAPDLVEVADGGGGQDPVQEEPERYAPEPEAPQQEQPEAPDYGGGDGGGSFDSGTDNGGGVDNG